MVEVCFEKNYYFKFGLVCWKPGICSNFRQIFLESFSEIPRIFQLFNNVLHLCGSLLLDFISDKLHNFKRNEINIKILLLYFILFILTPPDVQRIIHILKDVSIPLYYKRFK